MRDVAFVFLAVSALSACHDGSQSQSDMSDSDMLSIAVPDGACHQNTDCQKNQFCHWPFEHACGRGQVLGACVNYHPDRGCSPQDYFVCGCDGVSYPTQCYTDVLFGVSVDYGGPCRSGDRVKCHTSSDCASASGPSGAVGYCVADPSDDCTPTDGGAPCAGLCVHGNDTNSCGGGNQKCLSAVVNMKDFSPGTEACIAVTDPCPPDTTCYKGACVFTTGVSCQSQSDCGSTELCMPILGCDPSAGVPCRACVRP